MPFPAFARRRILGAIVDGIRIQHWFGRRAGRHLRIDRVGPDWQVALDVGDRAYNDIRWDGRRLVCPPTDTSGVNEQVAAALRGLPMLERRVVELHHYQEKTLTQAARELDIGRPWASRLHSRALATLRAALHESVSHPGPHARWHARFRLGEAREPARSRELLGSGAGTKGRLVRRPA